MCYVLPECVGIASSNLRNISTTFNGLYVKPFTHSLAK
ncbi:Hypothetical protein J6891_03591 [Nakaseomyces glabratus]